MIFMHSIAVERTPQGNILIIMNHFGTQNVRETKGKTCFTVAEIWPTKQK